MERTINWKPSDLKNGGAARTMETWVKTSGTNKALMSWEQDAVNQKVDMAKSG